MKKPTKHLPLIIGLSFLLVVYVLLLVFENELLFRSQELSLWLPTEMWFQRRMSYPAGFLTVVATFLNQFMFYPWLGALLLVGLWLAVYLLTLKVFRIPSHRSALALIPVSLLIGCALEVGYWIFLTKTQAFLFSAAVGFTFTMLAVRGWQLMRKPWERWVYIAVLIGAGFPLFGFYTLLAALLIALLAVISQQDNKSTGQQDNRWSSERRMEFTPIIPSRDRGRAELNRSKGKRDWVTVALCAVGIALVPYLYYYAYTMVRSNWIYLAGLPMFRLTKVQLVFWWPYFLLFLSAIALAFCRFKEKEAGEVEEPPVAQTKKNKKGKKAAKPKMSREALGNLCWNGGALVLSALLVFLFWYKDANFHNELKIEAAMEKMDYKGVLDIAKKQKTEPTRLIVMAKNLALLKLGRGGEEMFTYLDGGNRPNTPLDIRMMQVGGKMLYYNYARFNFCYRWCLEDGVEYGWRVEYLKYMTKCAILSGEYTSAQKYLNTLSKTWFHKKWAAHYQQFVDNPKLIQKDKEFATILPLYCYEDQLDGDNSLVEIYLLNYFAHSFGEKSTPMFDEAGLMCALILKDIPTFWQNFFRYANSHKTDRMPTHYQEAALLFGNLEPGKVDISKMPFEKGVKSRFQAFMEYARKNAITENAERDPVIKQKFYERFGNTYFYFYFFIRDVKSY